MRARARCSAYATATLSSASGSYLPSAMLDATCSWQLELPDWHTRAPYVTADPRGGCAQVIVRAALVAKLQLHDSIRLAGSSAQAGSRCRSAGTAASACSLQLHKECIW